MEGQALVMSDLSPAEVSAEMGLSRSAVYRAIEEGDLVAYRVRGRLRVEPAELAAFKRRERVKPRRPPAAPYEPIIWNRSLAEKASFGAELGSFRKGSAV